MARDSPVRATFYVHQQDSEFGLEKFVLDCYAPVSCRKKAHMEITVPLTTNNKYMPLV